MTLRSATTFAKVEFASYPDSRFFRYPHVFYNERFDLFDSAEKLQKSEKEEKSSGVFRCPCEGKKRLNVHKNLIHNGKLLMQRDTRFWYQQRQSMTPNDMKMWKQQKHQRQTLKGNCIPKP